MLRKKKPFQKRKIRVPKDCFFCTAKANPSYLDPTVLGRFVSDRGKIITKMETGICSKHQRRLGEEVKYARLLAIMPFVVRAR